MYLSQNAKKLIALLHSGGYKAYAVGGCVRDSLMGKEPKDVDIATSALPEQTERLLNEASIKCIETGIKHGTVTAVIEHTPYEITTFRSDGEYKDNRHPDSVSFVGDIKDDLARRDFTVNAMAYNDEEGIVDCFGGRDDLKKRIIRSVGNPDVRFNEDALRIMRALRFSSVLDFDIEKTTAVSAENNCALLSNIAVERIYTELVKLLMGDNCESVLLSYKKIIAQIIPELKPSFDCEQNSPWHIWDVYTHSVKSVALAPKKDYIRLAMLLHDSGKPFVKKTDELGVDHFKTHPLVSYDIACTVLKRLKVSREVFDKATLLVKIHDEHIYPEPASIKHYLKLYGEETTLDFIDVKLADMLTHNPDRVGETCERLRLTRKMCEQIIADKEPYNLSRLAVNGNDLLALGYKGSEIKKELDFLLDTVIEDKNKNEREYLLSLAKK